MKSFRNWGTNRTRCSNPGSSQVASTNSVSKIITHLNQNICSSNLQKSRLSNIWIATRCYRYGLR
jgi:hypothetical protein